MVIYNILLYSLNNLHSVLSAIFTIFPLILLSMFPFQMFTLLWVIFSFFLDDLLFPLHPSFPYKLLDALQSLKLAATVQIVVIRLGTYYY